MLFTEIVVDTYQDPTKKLFTYEVPEALTKKIRPGDLVEVPFGKRTVDGFVYQITTKPPKIKTKPIKNIKRRGVFTPNQIKIAHWLSSHYAAPPLDCLKCQIPGKGERYTEGKESEITTLLLVPYTTHVKLKAFTLTRAERKTTLVGSRSAVFTPLPNLRKIIIEEPENWVYKDERSPYYHAKQVAQKRSELEGLKLELHYLIPRVEDFPSVNLSGLRFPTRKVELVDLKKERETGNFSPLSLAVVNAFAQGKRALAYVVSRGVKEEVAQAIKAGGLDINQVEIAGAEILTSVGKIFDTTAVVDTDTLFNLPDFRVHEKLLLTIAKLSRLVTGSILVQTANIDHPLFKELETNNLKNFYHRELEARKPFLYPPFGVLAKLEFSAKTTIKVNLEAEKLYETLTHDSRLPTDNIFISPPYPPYTKPRGKAQLNITVKARTYHDLQKILALVPPTWRVIVDPESLL